MKKTIRRLLTFALCLLMLLPVVALGVQAATIVDLPIVYVLGKYAEVWNADETQRLYPLDPPIMQDIKDNAGSIFLSFQAANNNLSSWKNCADKIYDTIAPRYEPLMMDDNGNPRNGVHVKRLEIPQQKPDGALAPASRGRPFHGRPEGVSYIPETCCAQDPY